MMRAVLYNGVAPGPELAWSRGLHYGDGVFRTALIWEGAVVDLDRQLCVLARDATRLDLQPPPPSLLAAECAALAAGCERAVLKLLLFRREGGRGYAASSRACDRLLLRSEAPRYPARHWDDGIVLAAADFRLAAQPRLAGIKHLNRLEQVLASQTTAGGANEHWLADAEGRPACGIRSNLFVVMAGTLYTPELGSCGVHGMMRDRIIEYARPLGIDVRLTALTPAMLAAAEECFVTNSLIGLWPVRLLDGRPLSAPGPLTRRLQGALQHPRLC